MAQSMTSRERVKAALQARPVDRVPVFMWFHPVTAVRMGRLLEIPPSRVSEAMGDDIAQIWVNNNFAMEGVVHERDGERHTDFWGIAWEKEGPFNQIVHSPLATASEAEVLAYKFPYEHLEELLTPMARLCAAARPDVFLGCDVSPCVFEMYWRLRGMEATFLDMGQSPRWPMRCSAAAPTSRIAFPSSPAGGSSSTGSGPATTWPGSLA